jgi:multicomponent Na+:H+ antiporter subunit D
MIRPVPPAFVFIAAALLLPLVGRHLKRPFLLLVPVLGFINLLQFHHGTYWVVPFLDYELVLCKVDALSLLFGYIFHLVTFLALIYALHLRDDLQHMAGLIYGGSALGVAFAGDLFSLFLFWELLSVSSVFLIWSRRTEASLAAGFRYLLVHAAGGLCLLAGIILHIHQSGSIAFGYLGLHGPATGLIFVGFGLNCAWPLLHPWLTDAYPEATVTGVVFLSAFTTKTAVYVLARAFPGTESLIWIGAIMTGFPIFYAVIENDLRRVLSYSLINQVGFMVCGIGIGTPLAINGAVCHAFNDILFKALLFMAMGAIIYRTGKINATDIGGLYRTMPLTCIFCMVGAASISAFPFFSGFVSKSMVMEAAALGHMQIIWFILLFASAGVFHHAGIKIPYFAFFSHDSGMRPKEAPLNMLIAMGLTAFLCVFIGSYPYPLYKLLPYAVDYKPYTATHVLSQSQLLFFSSLAFTLLILSGIYPAEMRNINVDVDWLYRKGALAFNTYALETLNAVDRVMGRTVNEGLVAQLVGFTREGPFRLAAWVMTPLWLMVGIQGSQLAIRKDHLRRVFEANSVPVGIGAAVATLFLFLFFVLN